MVAFGRRVEPASLDKVDAAMLELKKVRLEKVNQFKDFFDGSDNKYRNDIKAYWMEGQGRALRDMLRTNREIGIFKPEPILKIPSSSSAIDFTADIRLQEFHKWHDRVNSGFGRLIEGISQYTALRAGNIVQEALTILYQKEERILNEAIYATKNAASGDEVNGISMLEFKQTNGIQRLLVGVAEYLLEYDIRINPVAARRIISDILTIGNGASLLERVSERQGSL
jgi:hypothetical protein